MVNRAEGDFTQDQEKIMSMEIDEKPMHENKFEQFSTALFETLDQVTPQNMKQAKDYIEKYPEGNDELLFTVDIIGKLKALKNKQEVLDKLAKSKIVELDKLRMNGLSPMPDSLETAISQLAIACNALAQAKFPEDYAKQVKWAEEARAEETEEMKRKLQELDVS